MKTAVVKLSTLQRYKRWDARFYLGDPEAAAELKAAELRMTQAQDAVDRKRAGFVADQARIADMQASGEITEI